MRNLVAALISPSLEVGVRPSRVEPVTGIVVGLLGFFGGSLIVVTDSSNQGVALAGLGYRNTLLIRESLELRV